MLTEKSAGAVIFRKEKNVIRYLLLHYFYKSEYWDFCKGNIEQKENPEDTAKREIKEETGLEKIEIIPGFQEKTTWFYKRDKENVLKEVTYFLVETKVKEIKISKEHIGYGWFSFGEAMEKMRFKNNKEILKKANDFLAKRGGLGKFL